MKIKIEFTLEIDRADIAATAEFVGAENVRDIRGALTMEAADYVIGYLRDNVTTPRWVDRNSAHGN